MCDLWDLSRVSTRRSLQGQRLAGRQAGWGMWARCGWQLGGQVAGLAAQVVTLYLPRSWSPSHREAWLRRCPPPSASGVESRSPGSLRASDSLTLPTAR